MGEVVDSGPSVTSRVDARISVVRGPLWYVAVIAMVAQFMVQFDLSVTSIALPSIQRSLGLDASGLQWVVNSYTLVFGGLLLFGGRISDLLGRREVFLAGLWMFTFGSVLGGFAQNGGELVAARAIHGISGAILMPSTLGLILAAYQDKNRRNRAIAIWGAVSIIGGTSGVVLGGVLTQHLGWRSVLFICLPIGCLLLIFGTRTLTRRSVAPARISSLDIPGALSVVGGVAAAVYATIGLQKHSWGSAYTVVSFAVAAVLLIAFVVIERRSKNPLVPLDLFRSRSISMANVVSFVGTSAINAQVFMITLYIQKVLGYGPEKAGLAELPSGMTTFLVVTLTGQLVKRTGARRLLIIGPIVYAAGLVWISRLPAHGGYLGSVLFPLESLSLGMGLTLPCMTIAATAGAPEDSAGLVSGVATTTRQVGGAIGVAAFGSLAAMVTQRTVGNSAAALAGGYRAALLAAAVVSIVSALLALALPRDRPPDAPA
ncbi:MFS transporter [Nocardia sp. NEAU-G5]|uniref:MFS transporter n=1 Tax=Nocardia albiluteola TaxID=2842303 RepID=A0ABS6BCU5_9NOCA|nr:MFS transporter [Nocardia albiluteola]